MSFTSWSFSWLARFFEWVHRSTFEKIKYFEENFIYLLDLSIVLAIALTYIIRANKKYKIKVQYDESYLRNGFKSKIKPGALQYFLSFCLIVVGVALVCSILGMLLKPYWLFNAFLLILVYGGIIELYDIIQNRRSKTKLIEEDPKSREQKNPDRQTRLGTSLDKWGFYPKTKGSLWVNSVSHSVVVPNDLDEEYVNPFYSEWLIITKDWIVINPGYTKYDCREHDEVTYDFTKKRTYAWNGCSPKFRVWGFFRLGTPDLWKTVTNYLTLRVSEAVLVDEIEDTRKEVDSSQGECVDDFTIENEERTLEIVELIKTYSPWKAAHRASLVHDALYQYLHVHNYSKESVDRLFKQHLIEDGVPKLIASIYQLAVIFGGGTEVEKLPDDDRKKFYARKMSLELDKLPIETDFQY